VGNSHQCVPHNAEPTPTCSGMRDLGSDCEAWVTDCGVEEVSDGTCLPFGNYCSVRCDQTGPQEPPMCPEGWTCQGAGGFNICIQ
jgi:hypothetical protein